MKIAIISDIHGNLEALTAVINDIEQENVDNVFVCGDLAMAGPNPVEVIDTLQKLAENKDLTFVLGNTDEMILKANENDCTDYLPGDETMRAALTYTQQVLDEKQIEFIRDIPEQQVVMVDSLSVLIVHGSPRNIGENITPELDENVMKQMLEGHNENIIFCGHTHLPVIHKINNQTVVNAGSVGRPFTDNPLACYAVLEIMGKDFDVHHKYVKYDHKTTADKLTRMGFVGCEKLAKVILNPSDRHHLFK